MALASGMTVAQGPAEPYADPRPRRDEFDAFLYSVIREDESGQSLTVLSLLARQNIDAWDEAADYMRSPRPAAIAKLSDLLANQAARKPADEASLELAGRLLELLPEPRSAGPAPAGQLWPALVRKFERFKNATRVWIQNDRR